MSQMYWTGSENKPRSARMRTDAHRKYAVYGVHPAQETNQNVNVFALARQAGRNKEMDVKDYMKLPYTRLVQEMHDESGHYFYGRILELDGCQSTSDTLAGLYQSLNEAMEGYFEVKLENNLPIPIPETTDKYSGKFIVRLPKSLHQRLAIEAEKEGVSLNQLALYKLAL